MYQSLSRSSLYTFVKVTAMTVFFCMGKHSLAGEVDEFEQFKAQQSQGAKADTLAFEAYKKKLNKAFNDYKTLTGKIWGDQAALPSSTRWISFQGDLLHRSEVDFEKGLVTVSYVTSKRPSDRQVRNQLAQQIKQLAAQGRDPRSITEISRDPVSVSSGEPILKPLLDQQQLSALTQGKNLQVQKDSVKGGDGRTRKRYKAEFKLVPDHIRRRALKYRDMVIKAANRQKISAPLVFAIMETESMFNPNARSAAPAFGLMQLVPSAGAREAYRYLYNHDRVVTDTYLYNPQNNINLGTAFINRLYYRYLQQIKNPQARQWASIAAYNTGVSNVFRAIKGKYSAARFGSWANYRRAVFDVINRMSAEQLYAYLRQHLPYLETRRYLEKVRSRIHKYKT